MISMIEKLRHHKILLLIAIINFIVGFYSISYYFWQLETTNPLFWIFVIDCPLYSILFGVNLILLSKNKINPVLTLASIVGSIKYGLWTIVALALPGLLFSYPTFVLGHVLLAIEVLLLFKVVRFKVKHFLIVLGWFLANDILDYFYNIHPYFEEAYFYEIMIFSFISSIIIAILVSTFFSKR